MSQTLCLSQGKLIFSAHCLKPCRLDGVWTLKANEMDEFHSYIVISYLTETRVLNFNEMTSQIEDYTENFEIEPQCSTVYMGSLPGGNFVQIHNRAVNLLQRGMLTCIRILIIIQRI